MVKVKICGITSLEDAIYAVEQGADAVGTVLEPSSPRVFIGDAARFAEELPDTPLVAVFGPFASVSNLSSYTHVQAVTPRNEGGTDITSRSGEEVGLVNLVRDKQPVWIKVLLVAVEDSLEALVARAGGYGLIHLDKASAIHGGTGEAIDWQLARGLVQAMPQTKVILAGGLNPDNVRRAVEIVRPYAVDASSGLEGGPGKKNRDLVRRFIQESKSA